MGEEPFPVGDGEIAVIVPVDIRIDIPVPLVEIGGNENIQPAVVIEVLYGYVVGLVRGEHAGVIDAVAIFAAPKDGHCAFVINIAVYAGTGTKD